METEVRILREDWSSVMQTSMETRRDRIIYEMFLLLEKMVDMIGDHENQLNHVHRVPGEEGGVQFLKSSNCRCGWSRCRNRRAINSF